VAENAPRRELVAGAGLASPGIFSPWPLSLVVRADGFLLNIGW